MQELALPVEIASGIQEFLRRLKEAYPDARAYLFGSYARGDWLYGSDVDIIVVSPSLRGPLPERWGALRRLGSANLPFDILAYTPEELAQLLAESSTFRELAASWVEMTEETPKASME